MITVMCRQRRLLLLLLQPASQLVHNTHVGQKERLPPPCIGAPLACRYAKLLNGHRASRSGRHQPAFATTTTTIIL